MRHRGLGYNMREHEKYHRISDALIGLGIVLFFFFLIFILSFWTETFQSRKSQDKKLYDTVSLAEGQEKYHFLFLSSYGATFDTFEEQMKGIRSILDAHHIDLDNFSMNSKKFDRDEDYLAFYRYLRILFQERKPYDALIVGDDTALEFVMQYQELLFPKIPIVFFAVNNEDIARRAAENDYICGYLEPHYIDQTIETAMKLQPEAERIICIYDNTVTGIAELKNFYAMEEKFPALRFEALNTVEYTPEELEETLGALDKRTILLYLTAFRDKNGRNYSISESVKRITESSGTPVYRDGYGGFGEGVTGGKSLDFVRLGANAAYVAAEIVEKKLNVNDVKLSATAPGKYIFDYEQMRRYDLDLKKLPKHAIILNAPDEKNRSYFRIFGIMLLLTLSLACFWANSSLNRWLSEETADKLKISNQNLLSLQQELEHEASHDKGTGLLNRHSALEYLEKRLPQEKLYSVLLVDVDNLKEINEHYGHGVGDRFLKAVGLSLLEYSYSHKVLVSRFGGDEFMIVFLGKILEKGCQELKEIARIFNRPIEVGTGRIFMSACGGVANSLGAGGVQVVMDADTANGEAKLRGKNQVVFYDEELRAKLAERDALKKRVQDAVLGEHFYMVYQPQVDCRTMEVTGYEALVRMEGCDISPALFIPIAERYGYISTIGRMTTRMVVQQLAKWREEGMDLKPVSVNFSSRQVNDLGYVDYLLELLKRYGISSEYLVLEITEGLLLEETEDSRAMFHRLTEEGVHIHLDDFGTGYSSFLYLSYLPISTVKIDKTMVERYLGEKSNVMASIIDMTHAMGKTVIIEGVEEKWQYERLREFSCDSIQGYYFSKPLEAEKVKEWRADS